MTTVPGHNIIIQQSGTLREATQHVLSNRPDPGELVAQQAAKLNVEKTTVMESSDSRKTAADREKQRVLRLSRQTKAKKKKEREQEPDKPGNLLDTIA